MNLERSFVRIIALGQNYPLIALIIAVVFLFLIFRRPKLILSLFLLTLLLTGIYSLILDSASSAKKVKQKLIHESEENVK
jgi:hypothetical protein